MAHHPPAPPSYVAKGSTNLRYARPPYMGQASVGLSGHNQFKAPGLRTAVPPTIMTPPIYANDGSSGDMTIFQEPLYDISNYDVSDGGESPMDFDPGAVSGASRSSRHRRSYLEDDWANFRGPHVIRNNDLQYHYAEPFGFRQIILNSLNRTSTHAPENPSADFTITVGTEQGKSLQTAAQFNSNAVVLNDITLPESQYLIEDEWSRLDFSEGINTFTDFRNIHISFPNVYSNGHHVRVSGILPMRTNDIKSVSFESSTSFVVELEEEHSSNINAVQRFWEENLSLQSFSAIETGQIPLASEKTKLEHLTNKKIRIELLDGKEITPTVEEICGILATTAIPSPLHLQDVSNSMLESATPYRHDGTNKVDHHKDFPEETAPEYLIPQFTLTFDWNAEIDTFEFTYTITSDYDGEQPELSGEIFEYMGFGSKVKVPPFEGDSTSITVRARSQRQKSSLSGTRIAAGNYTSADDLALAMENSLNGTWFGGQGEGIDDINATVFHIYFVSQTLDLKTICVPAGRYTPCELADQINVSMANGFEVIDSSGTCGTGTPLQVEAIPVFDDSGIVFLGIEFRSRNEFPFAIDFQITPTEDPKMIDPRRLGYDREFYRGSVVYKPRDEIPYYPVFVQGGQQRIFRSLQAYEVKNNTLTNKLSIITKPFIFRDAYSFNYTGNRTGQIQLEIAHGIPAGQHIYLVFRYPSSKETIVSAIVLPGEPLECSDNSAFCRTCGSVPEELRGVKDPRVMNVCFGGTVANPFDGADDVVVGFTNQNIWTLDTSYGVEDCIRREALGFDNAFYGFINEGSSFRVPTNISGLEFSSDTTFVFPNSYQLKPYKYVLVKIDINSDQGDGNTIAVETDLEAGKRVSRGFDTFIARIPLGANVDTAHWNLDSNVFNIQHIAINKLNRIRVRIFNPDGTLYNFHGRPTSVGLAFNIVRHKHP